MYIHIGYNGLCLAESQLKWGLRHSWLLSRDTSGFTKLGSRDNETAYVLVEPWKGALKSHWDTVHHLVPQGPCRCRSLPLVLRRDCWEAEEGVIFRRSWRPAPGDDEDEMAPSTPMEIITRRAPAVSLRRVSVCENKGKTTFKLELAKLCATYNLK